jgi:hypothetical protein
MREFNRKIILEIRWLTKRRNKNKNETIQIGTAAQRRFLQSARHFQDSAYLRLISFTRKTFLSSLGFYQKGGCPILRPGEKVIAKSWPDSADTPVCRHGNEVRQIDLQRKQHWNQPDVIDCCVFLPFMYMSVDLQSSRARATTAIHPTRSDSTISVHSE